MVLKPWNIMHRETGVSKNRLDKHLSKIARYSWPCFAAAG